MRITRIAIRPVEMKKVKALASITIDDVFVIHDLRVVQGDRGFFVAMPSRKLPNGTHRDIAHPINSETRELIQAKVLEEFDQNDIEAPEAPEAPEWQPQTNR
ncbi:MAG: septation regulator SpoVG [Actinomycetia bacterium]|nr:septation regulator SpoVG [Actinomycetes bacterium]